MAVQVGGEAAHRAEPDAPASAATPRREAIAQARASSMVMVVDAAFFEVADELAEQPAGAVQLEPQRPAQR